MATYHSFTTNRATMLNRLDLIEDIRAAVDITVEIFQHPDGTYRATKATDWTASQIAAAQVAIDTCAADTPQLQAQQFVDAMPVFEKAIILTILDQFNVVRAKLVPPLAAVTVEQMIAAVRAKAGTL